jgi:hypothetical protein
MLAGRIRIAERLCRGVRRGRSLILKPMLLLAGLSVLGGTACYGPPPVEVPTEETLTQQQPASAEPASPEASEEPVEGSPSHELADAP